MKKTQKLVSLILALVFALSLSIPAFAADAVGTITINGTSEVSVAGKTFRAFKILDLDVVPNASDPSKTGFVYTVPAGLEKFYKTELKITDESRPSDFDELVYNYIGKMNNNPEELFAFASRALAAADEVGLKANEATGVQDYQDADETYAKFENLALGYYLIEDVDLDDDVPLSALVLDSNHENVDITIKARRPTIDKNIIDAKQQLIKFNNTSIGDEVPYQLTSRVPDMTGYTQYFYMVTDVMSKGLTFNNDVEITIGGTKLEADAFTVEYTTDADTGETTVEINVKNFFQYKAQKDAEILITYTATVNENALIGVEGNPNKVTLTYSRKPNSSFEGEKPGSDYPVGVTPEVKTYTYVTDLNILKVNENDEILTGATFTITGTTLNKAWITGDKFTKNPDGEYWMLKDGSYTKTPPVTADDVTNTEAEYMSTTVKYKQETIETYNESTDPVGEITYTGTVNAYGELTFKGLSAGTYTITEAKAPNGYNLLKESIEMQIDWTKPTDGNTKCEWKYTIKGTTDEPLTADQDGKYVLKIVNRAGTELPSTGGMGTTILYVAGGLMVALALIVMISKKRVSEK